MGIFDWLFRRKRSTLEDREIGTGAAAGAPVWGTTDDAGADDSDAGSFDVGGSDGGGGFDGGGGGADG